MEQGWCVLAEPAFSWEQMTRGTPLREDRMTSTLADERNQGFFKGTRSLPVAQNTGVPAPGQEYNCLNMGSYMLAWGSMKYLF
jgi:hypothetical protein